MLVVWLQVSVSAYQGFEPYTNDERQGSRPLARSCDLTATDSLRQVGERKEEEEEEESPVVTLAREELSSEAGVVRGTAEQDRKEKEKPGAGRAMEAVEGHTPSAELAVQQLNSDLSGPHSEGPLEVCVTVVQPSGAATERSKGSSGPADGSPGVLQLGSFFDGSPSPGVRVVKPIHPALTGFEESASRGGNGE